MADPWFVEIVLDTGQRYQSVDLEGPERAASVADDMRGRVRVVAVTMVQARTGECITKPSLNLAAGVSRASAGLRMALPCLTFTSDARNIGGCDGHTR